MNLKKFFTRADPEPRIWSAAEGERLYAIGDVHGRADCLAFVLAAIEADDGARDSAHTKIIFLGDLVDRGPDSRGVIEQAMALAKRRDCVFLLGNHEEIMLRLWEGDVRAAALFHRVGGRATLLSYGMSEDAYDACDLDGLAVAAAEFFPPDQIAFLRSFGDDYVSGDYLFVHAGIRPGIALEAQTRSDLRWIRDEFLNDTRDHGYMVVHGHSITTDIDEQPNRIGVDTGAFATGKLTALGIQGSERWTISS